MLVEVGPQANGVGFRNAEHQQAWLRRPRAILALREARQAPMAGGFHNRSELPHPLGIVAGRKPVGPRIAGRDEGPIPKAVSPEQVIDVR